MNPWWRGAHGWQRRDPDLRAADTSHLSYQPAALADLRPGGLYILRGPRRVGKTVTTKQAIANLLAAGTPPTTIVRLAADGWDAGVLRTVVQNVPTPPPPPGHHRWWFMDEVTAMTGDWATQIKWLRDNLAEFRDATVVLTGSSAAELTQAAGTLAGRRGPVTNSDRTLMPMGFRTFASLWHPDLATLPVLELHEMHTRVGDAAYQQALPWLSDLVPLWETYLRYGGFPVSVAAAWAGQPIPPHFVDALFDVIYRDAFAKSSLDEQGTTALVERLWASTSSPVNLRAIGEDLGQAHTTVQRHVGYLRDAYLLWSCPQMASEWVPRPRSQIKLYPIDPLIGRLPHLRNAARSDLDVTVLTEAQIGMCLRRALMRGGSSWAQDPSLFHLRTVTRTEIDFVAEAFGGAALEGKYTQRGKWQGEAATVDASNYKGILATRNVLDTSRGDEAWAVPACVLALLVDS